MSDFAFNEHPAADMATARIKSKKGRLMMDLPVASFQTAFAGFSAAAEEFATKLSDSFDRKYAFQYFIYLQEFARGNDPAKLSTFARGPSCRLISIELERLFRYHFFQPEAVAS